MANTSMGNGTDDKAPSITLRCNALGDGSLQITVESINEAFCWFYQLQADEKPEGKAVREVLPQDVLLVDGWFEFILKECAGWHSNAAGGTAMFESLQYVQRIRSWRQVKLTYNVAGRLAEVCFYPWNCDAPAGQHLMEVKQKLWLDNFVQGCGNWEIDLPSQTIWLSRELAQTLQLAADAAIVPLERFIGMIHPQDAGRVVSALENVENEHISIKNRGILQDGSVLYFNSYGVPGYKKDGNIVRIVGHSKNVTETERASERLKINEQRLRKIVETSPDIYVVAGRGGVISYVSPNIWEYTGYRPDEMTGRHYSEFVCSQADVKKLAQLFNDVQKGGGNNPDKYQIKAADGSTLWFHISLSSISIPSSGQQEVMAVCCDIAEGTLPAVQMGYWSMHDALTGLHNRLYFESELARIQTEGILDVGVMALDVNGLKQTNDQYGHKRGDQLLVEAVGVLSNVCTGDFSLFRVGGDEFAVLVFDTTEKEMEWMGKCVDAECAKTLARDVALNLSWGVACRTAPELSAQQLYTQAETSMFSNKLLHSSSVRSHVLFSLKEALRARNLETADHTMRMENMVVTLGRQLGLSSGDFDRLVLLASMHDIGKVAIPDSIINKAGPLDADEWQIMRTHSELGARIARTSPQLSVIAGEIASHHERWDGNGYPAGLARQEIPLLSRIINVVDAYDVMTHKRVYKEAVSHLWAIEEIKRCAGTQFDPEIAQLFLDIFGSLSHESMQALLVGKMPE